MNGTIAWITLRGLLGRRRFLLLFPLPLILIGLAAAGAAGGDDPTELAGPILVGIGVAVVLPVVALIIGTGVLGSEIDDGTIVHILTKPVPRWKIIVSKLVVAIGVTALTAAGSMLVSATLIDGMRFAVGFAAATVVGAIAYSALFMLLSLVTKRPVLIGLLYVLIWEGLLGNFLSGTKVLSIQQYVVSMAQRWADTDLITGTVSMTLALSMSAAFLVAGTWLAINRLQSFSVAGETS